MAIKQIPRRTVLRGAGGAALALPALDIMRARHAKAAGVAPLRFVICYSGVSIGNASTKTGPWELVVPTRTGKDYEITPGLKAIEEAGVKADMGLVSGLRIPWAKGFTQADMPAGGHTGFHGTTKVCPIAGTACDGRGDLQETPRGPSADQIIAEVIAGPTRFKSLPLCVTPQVQTPETSTVSFEKRVVPAFDPWGRPFSHPIAPFISPKVIYQKLFGDATLGGADQLLLAKNLLERKKSVLDVVSHRTRQLMARVGQEDKRQLDRYFGLVSNLEQRIRSLDPAAASECKKPPAVTQDPAPPSGIDLQKVDPADMEGYRTVAWSNETLRAQLQVDFIATAFKCDLTRVVGWQWGESQCGINMYPINGQLGDFHGAGHFNPGGSIQNMASVINWHVGHLARLVKALQVPDIDGRRVIDNTVILMCFEGGVGRDPFLATGEDPEGTYQAGIRWSHSTENMIVLMAGGGGGLKSGQHIQYNPWPTKPEWSAKDRHPAQVMLTAMKALGYQGDALGEVKGTLPEMFTLAG